MSVFLTAVHLPINMNPNPQNIKNTKQIKSNKGVGQKAAWRCGGLGGGASEGSPSPSLALPAFHTTHTSAIFACSKRLCVEVPWHLSPFSTGLRFV